MAKRKSKPKAKKQTQQVIAKEAVVSQEYLKLKRSIATLKRLPKDFRDIPAGTRDWEAFASITGRREEMEAWDNGPIIYLAPLNRHEEAILGSQNRLIPIAELKMINQSVMKIGSLERLTPENWIKVMEHAMVVGASWIYLPDEESRVVDALNVLFSRFGYNVRAKKRLMSEMSGQPVGVVH